jgi:opacity protein-like surface antigen
MMKKICAAVLAGAALLASAQAGAEDLSPGYVGAGIGVQSNYSTTCYNIDGCNDKTNSSGKLYGGYTLNTRTAFGSHQVTDSVELSSFWVNGKFVSDGVFQRRQKTTGVAVTWATAMDLGSGIGLNSRLGLAFTRTRDEGRGTGYPAWHSDYDRFGATAGVGLSYALNRNWSLRADYDYVPIKTSSGSKSDGHVNMWSVGTAYHF